MSLQPISTATLLSQLRWRYATKQFDPHKKIDTLHWEALEQSLILTPTSYGLQPYRFLVITDPSIRAQLVAASFGQSQPADCSHFLVIAAREKNTETDVDHYLNQVAITRGIDVSSLNGFKRLLINDIVQGPRSQISLEWASRQAYIALGNFLTASALLQIDTCPMEGFISARYDEILHLTGSGFQSVIACAAGHRSSEDPAAKLPKVRFPAHHLIQHY